MNLLTRYPLRIEGCVIEVVSFIFKSKLTEPFVLVTKKSNNERVSVEGASTYVQKKETKQLKKLADHEYRGTSSFHIQLVVKLKVSVWLKEIAVIKLPMVDESNIK